MAGRSRHYTTTFFMRRGAAAGMSNCPENGPAGHCERSLRSNLPVNEGDCFVLKDAGAIAHYAPRNDIFIRRGAAAGMGIYPENDHPAVAGLPTEPPRGLAALAGCSRSRTRPPKGSIPVARFSSAVGGRGYNNESGGLNEAAPVKDSFPPARASPAATKSPAHPSWAAYPDGHKWASSTSASTTRRAVRGAGGRRQPDEVRGGLRGRGDGRASGAGVRADRDVRAKRQVAGSATS